MIRPLISRWTIRRIPWACTVAMALCAAPAAAEPTAEDKAAAEALFVAGKQLMAESNFAAACRKFEESQRLDAGVGTLMYLSDCYEKSGRAASAWATWREAAAAAHAAGQADRENIARERAAALEPKLSTLRIEVPEESRIAGLVIKRDGTALSDVVWDVPTPIDPGIHVVEATAPGKVTWRGEVNVRKHAHKASITIPPLVDAGVAPVVAPPVQSYPPPPPPPMQQTPPPPTEDRGVAPQPSSSQKTWGYVLGGVGIVGIGAGTVFALTAKGQLDDRDKICPSEQNCTDAEVDENDRLTKDAKNNALAANIGLIGGGAALLGGIILIATAPKAQPARSGSMRLTPMVGSSQGVWIEGSW